jgi:hypothetical protein
LITGSRRTPRIAIHATREIFICLDDAVHKPANSEPPGNQVVVTVHGHPHLRYDDLQPPPAAHWARGNRCCANCQTICLSKVAKDGIRGRCQIRKITNRKSQKFLPSFALSNPSANLS